MCRPIRGSGRSVWSAWKPTAQSTSALRSVPTTITSSPIVLITRALSGSVSETMLDEPLDHLQRLLLAHLLGQARVPREVGEADRHPHPAQGGVVGDELEVADDVLLEEVPQQPRADRLHDRPGQREQLARRGRSAPRPSPARARRRGSSARGREVEKPDLRVGDLGERLAVHAHDLQEGDERQPGVQDAPNARSSSMSSSLSASSDAAGNPAAVQMRRISSASMPVSSAAASSVRGAPRPGRRTGPPGTRRRACPPSPRRGRAPANARAHAARRSRPARAPPASMRRPATGRSPPPPSGAGWRVDVERAGDVGQRVGHRDVARARRCGFSRSRYSRYCA